MTSEGLLDLQVNGFGGIDFNTTVITPEGVDQALTAMLRTGVTACLPTIITAHADELAARLQALDRAIAQSRLGPAMCPGYHLEGPFLNPAPGYRGCHPPDAMIAADADLVMRLEAPLQRPILLVTLAPEMPGALVAAETLAARGKIVAIGHSALNADQAQAAADAGAVMTTHLGNGVPQSVHKFANPIVAQLAEPRLAASFIADGIHVEPRALGVMMRARGKGQCVLVTDAVSGAGAPPGHYRFAGMDVERRADGSIRRMSDGALAGSALCLDQAVRHIVGWGLATAQEAVAMASRHPRALLAPALKARGLTLPETEMVWSRDLTVAGINSNNFAIQTAARALFV
ncbi:MAG: N-acetylglucosamine-6-phosphate deacetylase [Beijerinckiaceae bacterium]